MGSWENEVLLNYAWGVNLELEATLSYKQKAKYKYFNKYIYSGRPG